MRYSKKRQKRFIIIGLCFIVFLMCIGYAAFSTVLTINSTSEITSNWDVEITNVRGVNDSSLTYNDAYDKVAPSISDDKHSVTIQTGLLYPGDTRIYEIEVTNKGNINSEVSTKFENVINDSTIFSFNGVSPIGSDGYDILSAGGSYDTSLLETAEPFDLPAFTNNKRYLYLMIKFKDNVTSQPKDLNPSVTLRISAVQKSDNTPIVPKGEETVLVGGVEVPVITEGDGLYDNGDGTYTYKGENPDNYLSFHDSVWRILGVDSIGIKLISDELIDLSDYSGVSSSNSHVGTFDTARARQNSSNTYCYYACNIWVSTSKINGFPKIYINGSRSGTVQDDSTLYVYLNEKYYVDNLGSDSIIVDGIFNVGPYGNELLYTWTGKIALLTVSEYKSAGGALSYLRKPNSTTWWFLNPSESTQTYVRLALPDGTVNSHGSNGFNGVRPVLYLSKNVTLTGNGGSSSEDMFKIAS